MKKIIYFLISLFIFLFPLKVNAANLQCDPSQPGCNNNGTPATAPTSALQSTNLAPAGIQQLQDLIQRLIDLIVPMAFIAVLIMLLWGGIKLLISGGDTKAVQAARDIFVWTFVGILFLSIAWLVLLLIKAFTGVDVTHFCLSFSGC